MQGRDQFDLTSQSGHGNDPVYQLWSLNVALQWAKHYISDMKVDNMEIWLHQLPPKKPTQLHPNKTVAMVMNEIAISKFNENQIEATHPKLISLV